MKKISKIIGGGVFVITSSLFFSQHNVSAEITQMQKQLINQQIEDKLDNFVPGELIVGMNHGYQIEELFKNQSNLFGIDAQIIDDLTLKNSKNDKENNQVLLIKFDTKLELIKVIAHLENLPEIGYAEPNYIVNVEGDSQ